MGDARVVISLIVMSNANAFIEDDRRKLGLLNAAPSVMETDNNRIEKR